jgi:hypothetical protein
MSAIGFAAVADSSDIDGVLVFLIEEYPMLAAAEAEARKRGFEFFTSPVRLSR